MPSKYQQAYRTLLQRQSLPLGQKIKMSRKRIQAFKREQGDVHISFSGGKDSTVLLHLVRKVLGDGVPGVFYNTGLEYPEIGRFVRAWDNITIVQPDMTFKQVLEKYGYPVISKEVSKKVEAIRTLPADSKSVKLYTTGIRSDGAYRKDWLLPDKWRFLLNAPFKISDKCCYYLKKKPAGKFEKEHGSKPFIGMMAADSRMRLYRYLEYGCNTIDTKNPRSSPLAFWTEADIWEYLRRFDVPYCEIYDMGYLHTGCIYCGFGCHLEAPPNRFQRMAQTHPRLHKYCMDTLGLRDILAFINVPSEPQPTLDAYDEGDA